MKWFLYIRKMSILFLYLLQLQLTASTFSIISYNIRRKGPENLPARLWERRLPSIAHCINTELPGILGLQEALPEQINDLVTACPDYAYFGTGRGSTWFGWGKNEHNPIFYKKSQFTLLAQGTFHINSPSLVKRKQKGLLPRICTWGHFKENKTGKTFYVYNTHLDNKYHKARINELRIIINDIEQRVPNNVPVFLMGDFNSDQTEEITQLVHRVHLKNTRTHALVKKGSSITHTSWGSGRSCYIDHIFARTGLSGLSINRHEVIQNTYPIEPSDHYPVKIEISL